MRTRLSFSLGILAILAAVPAPAAGTMKLEFSGAAPEKMKGLRIEVLEVSGQKAKVAYKNDVAKMAGEGIDLSPGTYHVYLEDRETGLIVRVDNHGKGFKVTDHGMSNVDVADLGAKVKDIKERDRVDRQAAAEKLAQRPVKVRKAKDPRQADDRSGTPGPEGPGASQESEEHASGELLLKFHAETTLADRYALVTALKAEARSKLDKLDVYRVKVGDAADLQGTIQKFADDPRLKYMEMNMVASVPEPIGDGN